MQDSAPTGINELAEEIIKEYQRRLAERDLRWDPELEEAIRRLDRVSAMRLATRLGLSATLVGGLWPVEQANGLVCPSQVYVIEGCNPVWDNPQTYEAIASNLAASQAPLVPYPVMNDVECIPLYEAQTLNSPTISPLPTQTNTDTSENGTFIYKFGTRAKDLALHRQSDFETGLSFSYIPPFASYFTYSVEALTQAGYIVQFDGGMTVMNLWENRPYIEPNIQETIQFPEDHVTVYHPDYNYWLAWHEADKANLGTPTRSPQLEAFYNLRYQGG